MPSGYTSGANDLDSLLEPRGSSTPRANVGYAVDGVDIAQRYYATTGNDIPVSDTGYAVDGVDLRQLFRRFGYVPGPAITYISPNASYYVGNTVTLTCTATNATSYTWGGPGLPIGGATGSTVYFAPDHPGDSGTYTCTVEGPGGITTGSTQVSVSYAPAEISVVVTADRSFYVIGQTINLTAVASGEGPFSYQWYHLGDIIDGATSSGHSVYVATTMEAGEYSCTATDWTGSADGSVSVPVYYPPRASISGSSSVPHGGGGGGGWDVDVYSPYGLTSVAVGIVGHSTSPTSISGTDWSTHVSWGSPFGYPDVSSAPGSFSLFVQAYDSEGNSLYDEISVTVT